MKAKYNIVGMTCAACQSRIEKTLSNSSGVKDVRVNLMNNTMNIDFDETILNDYKIKKIVSDIGYSAYTNEHNITNNNYNLEGISYRTRLIVSIIFCIPLFYISMGSMGHLPMFPLPSFFLGAQNSMILALSELLLLLPIMFVNFKYFKNGFKSIANLSPNMDSLIALGSSSAFIYGIYIMYKISYGFSINDIHYVHKYAHDLYFEGAGMILTLITIGKYLESKSKSRASQAISKLMNLRPENARVLKDGLEYTIPLDELKAGDIIIIKSGEKIPTDSIIIDGQCHIDQSAISGESMPVLKRDGDEIIGATILVNGYVKARVERIGDETTLSNIIKLVEEATSSKAPIAKLADKICYYFVPTVISISILSFIFWILYYKDLEFALGIAISVLVISCPCALGLATPTAIVVGTGIAATNGILFKNATSIQELSKCSSAIMDKTGTLTIGKPVINKFESYIDKNELKNILIAIESQSTHPIAKAICDSLGVNSTYSAEEFRIINGRGITAKISSKDYYLGNQSLMDELNIDTSSYRDSDTPKDSSTLFIASNKLLGTINIHDAEKKTSKKAISLLKSLNIKTYMLTGDNHNVAKYIAKKIGIDNFISEVMPGDKEKFTRDIQQKGDKVIMVGDGINDAPALARADVGIAISSGMDIAMETSDIVLLKNDIIDVVKSIVISRSVMKSIKQNLFWAFIYNIIGIPLAAGVLYIPFHLKLNPMFASFAMSMSSIFVVSNSLRLKYIANNKFKSMNINNNEETICISDCTNLSNERNNNMKKTIYVDGMSCMHCSKRVSDALKNIEGVEEVNINLDTKEVVLSLTKEIDDNILKKSVEKAGYEVIQK